MQCLFSRLYGSSTRNVHLAQDSPTSIIYGCNISCSSWLHTSTLSQSTADDTAPLLVKAQIATKHALLRTAPYSPLAKKGSVKEGLSSGLFFSRKRGYSGDGGRVVEGYGQIYVDFLVQLEWFDMLTLVYPCLRLPSFMTLIQQVGCAVTTRWNLEIS